MASKYLLMSLALAPARRRVSRRLSGGAAGQESGPAEATEGPAAPGLATSARGQSESAGLAAEAAATAQEATGAGMPGLAGAADRPAAPQTQPAWQARPHSSATAQTAVGHPEAAAQAAEASFAEAEGSEARTGGSTPDGHAKSGARLPLGNGKELDLVKFMIAYESLRRGRPLPL